MAWRFRKSWTIIPGVRLTLTSKGLRAAIGPRGLNVSIGSTGTFLNAGIPGSGLSFRERLDRPARRQKATAPPPRIEPRVYVPPALPARFDPVPRLTPPPAPPPADEIRSGALGSMTSGTLEDFRRLVIEANTRQHEVGLAHAQATREVTSLRDRIHRIDGSWWRRRWQKKARAALAQGETEAAAELAQIAEDLKEAALPLAIKVAAPVAGAFAVLTQAFAAVEASSYVWDVTASRAVAQARERSFASANVVRTPVTFHRVPPAVLRADATPLVLHNANGGDLYIYPAFILIGEPGEARFHVVALTDVSLQYTRTRFAETERLPGDAERDGHTWTKVNKDGSPDRRFANNQQIPIAIYGGLAFSSTTGLKEEFLISCADAARAFVEAFVGLQDAARTSDGPPEEEPTAEPTSNSNRTQTPG